LLITSYKIEQRAPARDPAGENTAGIALLKQAVEDRRELEPGGDDASDGGAGCHLGTVQGQCQHCWIRQGFAS
jgi:type VI secretion system secreted protein VgrG